MSRKKIIKNQYREVLYFDQVTMAKTIVLGKLENAVMHVVVYCVSLILSCYLLPSIEKNLGQKKDLHLSEY